MTIKIRIRKIKGGVSYYLDIHNGTRRWKENTGVISLDRNYDRKQKREDVEQIRSRRIQSLSMGLEYSPVKMRSMLLIDYITERMNNSLNVNKRRFSAIINHLHNFSGRRHLTFGEVTPTFCRDFRDYLSKHLKGETPADYFKRFRSILNDAERDGIIERNPSRGVKNSNPVAGQLRKDVLTDQEIQLLSTTACGNIEVRRAFLFACFTGLRGGDIRSLTWEQIDLYSNTMTIVQNKTGHALTVPLNKTALRLLGFSRSGSVFSLPTQNGINKVLKAWSKRAGIQKHVTFHVARHSFITNVYLHTDNIKLAGSLAGHSSVKHTEKYVHIGDKQRRKAVDALPDIIG